MTARAALVSLLAVSAGCYRAPAGDGYPVGTTTPWTAATPMAFDDRGKAKVDGEVDYAARRRAQWFALELVGATEQLDISVDAGPGRRLVQLQLELVDPAGVVLARDRTTGHTGRHHLFAGGRGLAPGRYLVHVFTSSRDVPSKFWVVARRELRRGVALPPGCIYTTAPAQPSGGAAEVRQPSPLIPCIEELPALKGP